MAIATKSVLEMIIQQHQQQQQHCIYPFVSDPQRNEIDSMKRFEQEIFPDSVALEAYETYHSNIMMMLNTGEILNGVDNNPSHRLLLPNLSYTVGDFVSTYSTPSKRGQYDIIVTSFFIDTATNIYEYIMIMKHLLHSSNVSLWVNCGPVQWHPCALLHPTVEELRDILEVSGFELITWEIAEDVVAYRHSDDLAGGVDARYTRSEGYRPLRFVASLKKGHEEGGVGVEDLPERIEYTQFLNSVVNG